MDTSTSAQAQTIIATLISGDQERLEALPRHFGPLMMIFEDSVYQFMRHLCSEYNGAYWQFFELSNGGFYMAPELGGTATLELLEGRRQVIARGEMAARAPQRDHAHAVRRSRFIERLAQLRPLMLVEGIHLLGAIEADPAQAVFFVDFQCGERRRHERESPGR